MSCSNLSFEVHVVFKEEFQDVHMTILTCCLHSSVSSTLSIHLKKKKEQNTRKHQNPAFVILDSKQMRHR